MFVPMVSATGGDAKTWGFAAKTRVSNRSVAAGPGIYISFIMSSFRDVKVVNGTCRWREPGEM